MLRDTTTKLPEMMMANSYAKQLMKQINESENSPEIEKALDIIDKEIRGLSNALRNQKNKNERKAYEMAISELGFVRNKIEKMNIPYYDQK